MSTLANHPRADGVNQILAHAPALIGRARGMFAELATKRADIRARLVTSGFISAMPTDIATRDLVCVDGATATKGLYAADLIVSAAVAVEGATPTGRVPAGSDVLAWSNLVSHAVGSDRLASAIMACAELRLLAEQPHDLVVVDGSHQTFVLSLASALRSVDTDLLPILVDVIEQWDIPAALAQVARDPRIVACPKSDATDAFATIVARDPVNLPADLQRTLVAGDKVLAAMLLHPGEMTRPSPAPKTWSQLRIAHGELTGRAKKAADALEAAIAPMRDAATEGGDQGIGITYVMPPGAVTALKIEHKRSAGTDQVRSIARSLAADVLAPHAQEPVCQYRADVHAKTAVSVIDLLHEQISRDLAATGEGWGRFFMLSHRT